MPYDLFFNSIRRYVDLSEPDEQTILPCLVHRTFKRGEYINAEGEVNRYTNFLLQGSARVFFIDVKGQEHVVQLGIPGWWLSDFASFISQTPGMLYTEALEPVEVISLSHDNLQLLFDAVPKLERFYRILVQKAYTAFQKRTLNNLSLDAEARYRSFRTEYPEVDARVSQKHIASYLGMSAEFLSKIKKRIVQNQKLKTRGG